jgi:hypothetical protein
VTRAGWELEVVVRLRREINLWRRPTASPERLSPRVATSELCAWARDDGRWNPRRMADWPALFDDAAFSWDSVGPRLKTTGHVEEPLLALRRVASADRITENAHRSSVCDACTALYAALSLPTSLQAAFEDVVDAARADTAQVADPETMWRLAILADVVDASGHDWGVLAQRVHHTLDEFPESETSLLDLAQPALAAPPDEGHSVVWLAVDHAHAWGPAPDPAVQLFDGDWLLAVLREDGGRRDGVPEELVADPDMMLRVFRRLEDGTPPGELLPVVLARVDLGHGPAAGARSRARDALEALIARASIRQGGTNWSVSRGCLHYLDGRVVYQSAGPVGDADAYDRLTRGDVLGDRTGELVKAELVRLGGRLPWHDAELSEALALARWLSRARRAPGAARLVLSGRVVEHGALWAGMTVREFVEILLDQWSVQRVAERLGRVGRAAVLQLPGADGNTSTRDERNEFLEASHEILDSQGRQLPLADPHAVLRRLAWLTDRHDPTTEIGGALLELGRLLSDGPAASAWLAEIRSGGTRRNARAVRTRNMIVHGGPLIAEIVPTVVGVQDALAHQALDWVIEAHTGGPAMPALVQAKGEALTNGRRRLHDASATPFEVLPGLFSGQPQIED